MFILDRRLRISDTTTFSTLVTTLTINNMYIGVALDDASVHIFSFFDLALALRLDQPQGHVAWAIALLDEQVVTGCANGSLYIWSLADG